MAEELEQQLKEAQQHRITREQQVKVFLQQQNEYYKLNREVNLLLTEVTENLTSELSKIQIIKNNLLQLKEATTADSRELAALEKEVLLQLRKYLQNNM